MCHNVPIDFGTDPRKESQLDFIVRRGLYIEKILMDVDLVLM